MCKAVRVVDMVVDKHPDCTVTVLDELYNSHNEVMYNARQTNTVLLIVLSSCTFYSHVTKPPDLK